MSQLISIGTAVQFLTRLPVGRFCSGNPTALSASSTYFPLVGFCVGSIVGLCLWLLQFVLPVSAALMLVLAVAIALTGALHEDGLADVADSAGAFGLEKKLEIMRDSRLGTYGTLALILLILVKFVTLWELARISLVYCVMAIVAAHVLSRWSSVWLMACVNYARPAATNKAVADGVTTRHLLQSSLCVLLVFLPLAFWGTPFVYLLFPVAWLVVFACAQRFRKVFGGITGDCIGAANQLVEVVLYLVVLAACWQAQASL